MNKKLYIFSGTLIVLGGIILFGLRYSNIATQIFIGKQESQIDEKYNNKENIDQEDIVNNEEPSQEADAFVSRRNPHEVRYSDKHEILYMNRNNQLIFHDIDLRKKIIVATGVEIVDYDISHDGKKVIYAKRLGQYSIESDLYIFDVDSFEIKKISDTTSIAEINPVFFPGDNKIVYVRRLINEKSEALSDGEIWTMDLDSADAKGQKLAGDNQKAFIDISELSMNYDEYGIWDGTYMCISPKEIAAPKIGINYISSDGKYISYWKSSWVPECSGLMESGRFMNTDGSEFFSNSFMKNNWMTEKSEYDGKNHDYPWTTSGTFWLPGGSFITTNYIEPPLGGSATFVFDNQQKKIATIFDSSRYEQRLGLAKWPFSLLDVNPIGEDKALITYRLFMASDTSTDMPSGSAIYTKEISLKKDVSLEELLSGEKLFSVDNSRNFASNKFKLLEKGKLIYQEYVQGGQDNLYIFDIDNHGELKLDELN